MKVYIYLFLILLLSTLQAEKINQKVRQENRFGVELNPIRLVLLNNNGLTSLSGGFSYFNYKEGIEIAIPWVYTADKFDDYGAMGKDEVEKAFNLDLQYRVYNNGKIGGAFIGGLARYTYLQAPRKDFAVFDTQDKFGLGAIIGIRKMNLFDTIPLYWGMSLSAGAYLNAENDIFRDSLFEIDFDDNRFFLDIELLKLGYEF